LCVFRVSGSGCLNVFDSIFTKELNEPRKFYQRSLVSGSTVIDTVGVVFF
jgi:tRNA U34 5-carboxymethylaminomethyl modifying GTPase MnmE/TrmE